MDLKDHLESRLTRETLDHLVLSVNLAVQVSQETADRQVLRVCRDSQDHKAMLEVPERKDKEDFQDKREHKGTLGMLGIPAAPDHRVFLV